MELERRLDECTEEFVNRLTDRAGFTREEATDFVESALPALRESYAWQAEALDAAGLDSMSGVRWLLAGVRARTLASRAGLTPQRTWDALRAMVPAIVREADDPSAPGDPMRLDGGFDVSTAPTSSTNGAAPIGARPSGIVHPIFGSPLRMRELHHS